MTVVGPVALMEDEISMPYDTLLSDAVWSSQWRPKLLQGAVCLVRITLSIVKFVNFKEGVRF